MLIAMQFINHFQEALLPLFINKGYHMLKGYLTERFQWARRIFGDPNCGDSSGSKVENNNQDLVDSIWSPTSLGLIALDSTDARIVNSKKEIDMDPYEGTFDDYLEMFVQFGYVFLFSAVYPLAAVWAVVNNLLEIRADAFKLCEVFQRPTAKRVKDIGAWQIAFELMGGIAVMTNCALLSLSPNLRAYAPNMSPAEWLLLFVIIEHVLLAFLFALRQLIPDIPANVKIALAKLEYQSRQALKNEQAFKSRRQLTRRFKTIHVAKKRPPTSPGSFVSLNSGTPSSVLIQRKNKPPKVNIKDATESTDGE
jgi:anoctamin-10